MDLKNITEEILKKNKEMDEIRKVIKQRTNDKAEKDAEYDRVLAVTIVRLLNNDEMEIEGNKITGVKATNVEKIARGICWKEKLEMEKAEGLLKSAVSNLKSVETQISSLQSINRHLDMV